MDSNPVRRVSYDQMKVIMDFMGQNVDFAMGVLRTTEARAKSKCLWNELAKNVNRIGGGVKKTPDMWSRYWSDFKNKLKKKVKILNRKKRLGASSNKEVKPLSNLEKRALIILGPTFSKLYNKDTKSYSKNVPLEVKLEDYETTGEFCDEPSESSDKMSLSHFQDGEKDDDDDDSEGSNPEENGNDVEYTLNDPALSHIYPQWLIDMEKKRADAELIRARADEQRVAVAAKSAEAAILQAEALKKMSEAATAQADALMRIATYLESRGHSSQHLMPM